MPEVADTTANEGNHPFDPATETWESLCKNPERFYQLYLAHEEKGAQAMRAVSMTAASIATIDSLHTLSFEDFVRCYVHNEDMGRHLFGSLSGNTKPSRLVDFFRKSITGIDGDTDILRYQS